MNGVVLQKFATLSQLRQIERRLVAADFDPHVDAGRRAVNAAFVDMILSFVDAIRQLADRCAHFGFGKIVQPGERADENLRSVLRA